MINPEFIELNIGDPEDYPNSLVVRVDDIVSVVEPNGVQGAYHPYCEVTLRTGQVHTVSQWYRNVVRAMVASGRCRVTNNPAPYSKTAADRTACGDG